MLLSGLNLSSSQYFASNQHCFHCFVAGMTIVEAAAFGVPTLMHNESSSIGAKDLLPESARFVADMADVAATANVLGSLVR
eukprot:COSAG02_NODE_428_length_22489_cov_4.690219_13_plen_81_part_00